MKILMLTPYLPFPPSSGGQVRSYNLIKNISKKHEITLFSLIKTDEEKKYVSELEKFCKRVEVFKRPEKPWTLKNILKTGFGYYPFLVVRNSSRAEKEAIVEELDTGNYQLIHAETFYVMPHIPETRIPIILVDQTIEYQVYQHVADTFKHWFLKPFLYIDVFKLKYWETKFWKKASKVVAVSQADKDKMLSLVPGLNVDVVPNGAGEDLVNLWEERQKATNQKIIFFQGNFSWLQNVEAARTLVKDIYPLIRKKIPDSICWIVGQGASDKVSELQGSGVEVHNLNPDNIEGVRDAYRKAAIFLAPLAGPGGTRLKILGAMAAGIPVVTTQTGIEGIDAQNNKEVIIRETPTGIAKATIEILENKQLYDRLINSAKLLVSKQYNWQKISETLDKIYKEVEHTKSN